MNMLFSLMLALVTVGVIGRDWWHFKEWHHNKNPIYSGIMFLLATFIMQQMITGTGKVSGVLPGRLLKPFLAVTAGLNCICTGLTEPLSHEIAESVLCLKWAGVIYWRLQNSLHCARRQCIKEGWVERTRAQQKLIYYWWNKLLELVNFVHVSLTYRAWETSAHRSLA